MIQGSGEIFDFLYGNTFSGRVNPTGDNPVPVNCITLPNESGYKKSDKHLITAIFQSDIHYAQKNTC